MHFPPKFLQKRFPPTFSMVHLLYRLYGVDAPGCPLHDFDHPLFFWVFNFPSICPSQGPMDPRGGRGTSADIYEIWCGSIHELLRYRSETTKMQKFTPIVTKISFSPFFAPRGPLNPKRGEDTSRTRVCPHAKFGVNWPAGCREIVDIKANKKTNKCVSKTDTNPPFAFQIAFPRGTDFTGFLQGGSKIKRLTIGNFRLNRILNRMGR